MHDHHHHFTPYTPTHAHTCAHSCTHTYTPMHTRIYTCIHTHIYTPTSTYTHTLAPPHTHPQGLVGLQGEELGEAETRAKQQLLGVVRLIAELYKMKVLPEMIMNVCVSDLLGDEKNVPPEDNIEVCCIGRGGDECLGRSGGECGVGGERMGGYGWDMYVYPKTNMCVQAQQHSYINMCLCISTPTSPHNHMHPHIPP